MGLFSTLLGPGELYSKVVREYSLKRIMKIDRISKFKLKRYGSTVIDFYLPEPLEMFFDFEYRFIKMSAPIKQHLSTTELTIADSRISNNQLHLNVRDGFNFSRQFDFVVKGESIYITSTKEDINLELVGIGGWSFQTL
jgi:hypothetical protein